MQSHNTIIYSATFLFHVALSLTLYINSTFVATFVGEKMVGIIYSVGSLLVLIALLCAPFVFKRVGGYRFALGTTLLFALSLLGLAFAKNGVTASIFVILSFMFTDMFLFTLDEFLKISTNNSELGHAKGTYLVVAHIALIGVQFIVWLGLGLLPFREIYLLAFATALSLFLLLKSHLRRIPEPKYAPVKHWKFIDKFFAVKNLRRAYLLSLLLQFFYAWMIIYTPIYLSTHLNFSWSEIGVILSVMLTPFLFVPAYLGNYGDKFGERKMLMMGFGVATLSTLLLFVVTIKSVLILAILLFFTRIGASSIYVMSETYFFKHIKPENEEFVSLYRTTIPVAYIFGPLVASGLFMVIPSFNFIYLVLSAIMLSGVYISSTIRKNDI